MKSEIQPADIVRALWEADYASERSEIAAWLKQEFTIREPYPDRLEPAPARVVLRQVAQ